MGKNKKWQNKSSAQMPASASEPPRQEPTVEQIQRLDKAGTEIGVITNEHGPPLPVAVPEPVGVTLEESLKRVEGLLTNAKALFEKARDQATSSEQLKKEIEAARKRADDDIAAKKRDIEQSELKVLKELEAIEKREADLAANEARLTDEKKRLTERELNADQGFRAEKAAVFKPLEEELSRLRQERARLESDVVALRERTSAEERIRANDRDARWAQQEAERIASDAEARRVLESDVAKARHDALAKLHDELRTERDRWEAEWRVELERRREALTAKEADLEQRDRQLSEKTRAHRAAHLELQAAQEILQEDRAGVDKKVQRLVAERTEALRHDAEALRKQLQDARGQRDSYFKELESRRELDRQLRGQPPEKILADIDALERERRSLQQQLRERPDTGAGNRVAALERERSTWLEERALLQADLAKVQGELASRRLAAIELEALRKQKEALEVHKQLLDGAVDELRARVDELTRQDDHRNPMTSLASLDDREDLKVEARTTTPFGRATPTLREFAEDLRHRIATGVKDRTLYYTQRDIRSFLGGLATTRLLLLQGISGTGKTSLPLAFVTAVDAGVEIVEVQAGWRDRQDLVGYYNAFHRHYYATNFLQALYKAGTPQFRDRLFVVILDEINLSRPEQFFADFLSALEQPLEKRRLTLLNDPLTNAPRLMVDGRHLPIPPNVWFIGTANHKSEEHT